jgi:CshA-type fibril repeat protein
VKLCATGQTPPACDKTSLDVANQGTYTVNPTTGVVTFDPLPTFTGQATAVTYQAKDTLNRTVSSTYRPTVGSPPAPSAQPDYTEAAWDVNQTSPVLTNDEPGSVSYPLLSSTVKICGTSQSPPNCSSTSLQVSNEGTYTVNNDGTITFDPLPTFSGDATPIRYQASDSLGQTTFTYYTPTVTVPPAPTATPDTVELIPGQSKVFSSIFDGQTGDADPALATKGTGGPNLTNSTVCIIDPTTSVCDTDGIVTIAGQGTYTLNSTTGIVTYAALSSATPGAKTPVTYQITDGLNRSVTSTLTPSITQAPVANPDFSTGVQGAIQTISPVGNDRPGGGASTELYPDTRVQVPSGIFLCAANEPPPDCAATTVDVFENNVKLGTLTVAATGLVTFTPAANFVGTTPAIGYQLPDNLGQKAYSTITITVVPPPAPSATIDTGSAEYNKPVTLKPWINDAPGTRPDNSLRQDGTPYPAPSLVATSIKLCGDNSTFIAMSGTPADCTATKVKTVEGTYEVNATTGEVTFTPNPNMVDPITGLATGKGFVGTVKYPPTYQIWNNWTGLGGAKSATALLVPTIAPPGAPAATVDITKTKPGTSVVLNPVSNDKPGTAALDPTTIRLCGTGEISPACTQMSVTTLDGLYVVDPASGQVTFTPRDGFTGQATIPYIIKDGLGMMALSSLIITVEDTAVVPVVKKTKVGLAKTGGTRPDLLLLLGLVAIAAAGGLRVLGRKK